MINYFSIYLGFTYHTAVVLPGEHLRDPKEQIATEEAQGTWQVPKVKKVAAFYPRFPVKRHYHYLFGQS